jgi:methyl-accepting chemotaxis protein
MFNPSSTETKIALLEERINVYEQMMERIDTAIQKIGETSQNISQMLAVHNEKIEQCNRTDNLIVSMIEDIKRSSREQHDAISKELGERIDNLEEKVESISQFKWKAIGAIAIVAFLIGVIPTATSLLTRPSSQVTIEQSK